MNDKPSKFGFKIKLSDETSEKLKQESQISVPIVEVKPTVTPLETVIPKTISDTKKNEHPESSSEESELEEDDDKPLNKDESASKASKPQRSDKGAKQEPPPSTNVSEVDYAKYVHYEGEVAIYTDPSSKQRFVWSKELNEWSSEPAKDVLSDSESSAEKVNTPEQKDDSRIYGFENNTHTYTDTDGSVYIWDTEKNAWFPKVDDDFLARYQMSYGFVDNTDAEKVAKPPEPVETAGEEKGEKRKLPEEPKWFEVAEEQNTNVYVSNLPLDITEEEFVDVMQKCGLVMRDPSNQKMKIKLYTKPNSQQLKGDALCTYIKIESVNLALSILDGYTIRNHRIQVQKAKFQMKGDFNPALKPKKKRKKDKEKFKKMQEKLFDWRPEKMRGERSKHEKIVIIKNLFEPSLFDKEVQLILEYQQDMREECSKCGEVRKVILFDRHPEGVAQVNMKDPEDADKVVQLINGRWFGKRQLTAEIWDGKTKYKMEETDTDINKRLENFGNFLENDATTKSEEKTAAPDKENKLNISL